MAEQTNEYKVVVDGKGTQRWYKMGSGPNWLLHRLKGPAVVYRGGREEWWVDGLQHREEDDGPAVTYSTGVKEWWWKGQLHRLRGPAVEAGKLKMWYQYNRKHREDGPAYIGRGGREEWWLHGREVTKEEVLGPEKEPIKMVDGKSPTIVRQDGSYEYWHHGCFHCDGGPAVRKADGTEIWYQHGLKHRVDGPAISRADGVYKWYYRGSLHCPVGPAVRGADVRQWWIHGVQVTQEEHTAWYDYQRSLPHDSTLRDHSYEEYIACQRARADQAKMQKVYEQFEKLTEGVDVNAVCKAEPPLVTKIENGFAYVGDKCIGQVNPGEVHDFNIRDIQEDEAGIKEIYEQVAATAETPVVEINGVRYVPAE